MSARALAELLKRQDAELADWRTAHGWWEPRRHDVSAERYSASQACVGELADKLIDAWRDVEVWRATTVALAAELADRGCYVPSRPAVLAYSHARNGRMAEALEVLA